MLRLCKLVVREHAFFSPLEVKFAYCASSFENICGNSALDNDKCIMQSRSSAVSDNNQFQFGCPYSNTMEPYRRWIRFPNNEVNLDLKFCRRIFSVMSYNILSQNLLQNHLHLYLNSPGDALRWEYRCTSIIWEIRRHNVDILCLQELEESDYRNVFKPQLLEFGYESMYKKKTGNKTDGCAIFYKSHVFSVEKHVAVEFKRPKEPLLNRDNIALVCLFKLKGTESDLGFCVSTTHLLFNPKRGDVRLAQLCVLLAEVERTAFKGISAAGVSEYHPVILCGDFNSIPFSPLYNFITSRNICCKNLLTGNVSGQKEGVGKGSEMSTKCIDLSLSGINQECQYIDAVSARMSCFKSPATLSKPLSSELGNVTLPDTTVSSARTYNTDISEVGHRPQGTAKAGMDEFCHKFNFVSAYQHFALDGSAEVTTFHSKVKNTVDYIFYTKPSNFEHSFKNWQNPVGSLLVVLGVYSLFSEMEMDAMGELPNWLFPSDHMCLVARFALCA